MVDNALKRLLHHRGAHAAVTIHQEQRLKLRMDGEQSCVDIRRWIATPLGHDFQRRQDQLGVSASHRIPHRVSASLPDGLPNGAKLLWPSVAR